MEWVDDVDVCTYGLEGMGWDVRSLGYLLIAQIYEGAYSSVLLSCQPQPCRGGGDNGLPAMWLVFSKKRIP